MFNFACKDTNNSQTTNYFWEFLYSLKWIFDHEDHGSRGDRYLSHSSRHTQVPVPATKLLHMLFQR